MDAMEEYEIYKAFLFQPNLLLNDELSFKSHCLYDTVLKSDNASVHQPNIQFDYAVSYSTAVRTVMWTEFYRTHCVMFFCIDVFYYYTLNTFVMNQKKKRFYLMMGTCSRNMS